MWMDTGLFNEWLHMFHTYIGNLKSRELMLLIEKYLARGKQETLPPLYTIHVDFLPLNTKRKVQLLDGGIISWTKNKYRHRLLLCVFDNNDMHQDSI